MQVPNEPVLSVLKRLGQPTAGIRVIDHEPKCVPAEAVLAESDLDDIVHRMQLNGHGAVAIHVGVLVAA